MCVMTSPISSFVTPLASARSRWPVSWSARFMAISAATVMRLRSRLESSGRSQMSPYTTFSLSSISLGATLRTSSRADSAACGVLTDGSFRRLAAPYVSIARAALKEALHAPMLHVDRRRTAAVHSGCEPGAERTRHARGRGQGNEHGRREVAGGQRQRRAVRGGAALHAGSAVAALPHQEPDPRHQLRDGLARRGNHPPAG